MLYEKYKRHSPENKDIWILISKNAGHNDLQNFIEKEGTDVNKKINDFLKICQFSPKNFDKFAKKIKFKEKEMFSLNIAYENFKNLEKKFTKNKNKKIQKGINNHESFYGKNNFHFDESYVDKKVENELLKY